MLGPVLDQAGEHLGLERLERFLVAEEAGDADQNVRIKGLDLGRSLPQALHVLGQRVQLAEDHAAGDAAVECVELVAGKIDAGAVAEDLQPSRACCPGRHSHECSRRISPVF